MENFEKIDFFYKNKIRLIDEEFFNKFNNDFLNRYEGYFMINVCQGKFYDKSRNGYNMTILNPEKRSAVYIVVITDKDRHILTFELQRFGIDLSKSGYIKGRSSENICISSQELRKIRADYSERNNQDGRFTNLKPRTNLDVACVTPVEGDMEFVCFEYDKKHREFRDIGGWKNE